MNHTQSRQHQQTMTTLQQKMQHPRVPSPPPTPVYADQSASRLMTLPKEIRNSIYTSVFCDNIESVRDPVRYYRDPEVVVAAAPTRISLSRSSPPSKGAILACRELYSEMKGMHAAAYRAHWSSNLFVYNDRRQNTRYCLPADRDLRHMQQFCLVPRHLLGYHIHIVFEEGKWESWLLPADGRVFGSDQIGVWTEGQRMLKRVVARYMVPTASTNGSSLDPRTGHGLTHEMLRGILDDEVVTMGIEELRNFEIVLTMAPTSLSSLGWPPIPT